MIHSEEIRTALEVGLQMYDIVHVQGKKPSIAEVVRKLDGRVDCKQISKSLDYLEDWGLLERSARNKYQPALNSCGIGYFEEIYKKAILPNV